MRGMRQARLLARNKRTWDAVADQFYGSEALPVWGPFNAGKKEKILGEIRGRTFLEIACGSGHSIRYLMRKGAGRVYGLDISSSQIAHAERLNEKWIVSGKVKLFRTEMERRIAIEPVDVVYSIYGFGWTVHPVKTLGHIYRYLKPGGRFVWSFEHAAYSDAEFRNGIFEVAHPYHDERPSLIWKRTRSKKGAWLAYRKVSTWFRLLAEAGFVVENYLEPEPVSTAQRYADPRKYYSTARAKLIPATMIFVCRKP